MARPAVTFSASCWSSPCNWLVPNYTAWWQGCWTTCQKSYTSAPWPTASSVVRSTWCVHYHI